MKIPRPRLNYANVVATIALFVALGGAAVAASLPKNSVGAKQLKRGAVTTDKLRHEAVTPAKLADGAVTRRKLGSDVAPLLRRLRSGQTLRGVFDIGSYTTVAGQTTRSAVSFPFPLSKSPEVTILDPGQTTPDCEGLGGGANQTPHAAPGHLCIYMTEKTMLNETRPLVVEMNTRLGFGLVAEAGKSGGEFFAYGQWAVTAP